MDGVNSWIIPRPSHSPRAPPISAQSFAKVFIIPTRWSYIGSVCPKNTPSMKLHSKNFKDHSSDLCQKKRKDMTIPGICVFKSTHGGKKELFNILLFLKGKLSLFLRVFGGFFPWKPALNDNFYGINVFIGWRNDCTLVLAPKFWNLDNFWLSYGTFSEKRANLPLIMDIWWFSC